MQRLRLKALELTSESIQKSKNSTIEMSLCRGRVETLSVQGLIPLFDQCLKVGQTNDHDALLVGIYSKLNSKGEGEQIRASFEKNRQLQEVWGQVKRYCAAKRIVG